MKLVQIVLSSLHRPFTSIFSPSVFLLSNRESPLPGSHAWSFRRGKYPCGVIGVDKRRGIWKGLNFDLTLHFEPVRHIKHRVI